MDMRVKNLLTVTFSLTLISFIFNFNWLLILPLVFLYLSLLEVEFVFKITDAVIWTLKTIAENLFKFLLSIVFAFFIAPYSFVIKLFQSNKVVNVSSNWRPSEFNYQNKNYFTQPW
jgi:hypothetical protein